MTNFRLTKKKETTNLFILHFSFLSFRQHFHESHLLFACIRRVYFAFLWFNEFLTERKRKYKTKENVHIAGFAAMKRNVDRSLHGIRCMKFGFLSSFFCFVHGSGPDDLCCQLYQISNHLSSLSSYESFDDFTKMTYLCVLNFRARTCCVRCCAQIMDGYIYILSLTRVSRERNFCVIKYIYELLR